jgi:hypothetical protein
MTLAEPCQSLSTGIVRGLGRTMPQIAGKHTRPAGKLCLDADRRISMFSSVYVDAPVREWRDRIRTSRRGRWLGPARL